MTQSEFIGSGEIARLGPILSECGSQRVFLVTGRDSFRQCGAEKALQDALGSFDMCLFNNFSTNPKLQDILFGIDRCSVFKPDTIVAIGGGSVIDVAKGIRFLGTHRKVIGSCDIKPRLPDIGCRTLVAIPTTSGSGSESTHFFVVYVDKEKHSVGDASILPEVAIVDAGLTMTLSPYQTAASGMDALSHAIESYWSVHSTRISKKLAREAVQLIMQNLVQAVNDPSPESRLKMAQAAHMSGKAINITKTTAPHSISYPLTAYFDIPHGHAVALTLPSLLIFNSEVTDSDAVDQRGAEYVKTAIEDICRMVGSHTVGEAARHIDDLMSRIGLPNRLKALGLRSEDLDSIVAHGLDPQRAGNNPRLFTKPDLIEILQTIY